MVTREINEYFRARFVQILKAPEIISIWTILGDPGAVSWVRKNGGESFKNGQENLWDAILNKQFHLFHCVFVIGHKK